jgi:hypothetical protein
MVAPLCIALSIIVELSLAGQTPNGDRAQLTIKGTSHKKPVPFLPKAVEQVEGRTPQQI